ncbi:ABC transporter substrate-binding protein [Actinomarinicola tropica]|uniref:ABC transporter substrate-binding protein n=1 Tax=Actinomarinicola tropica TaxID=2789776 RepID=UPI00189B5124|nr:ABC transporter substrate-binding protein [Actinomarinicola tropica]
MAAACGDDSGDGGDGGGDGEGEGAITSTTVESDVDEVTTGGTVVVALEAETNNWQPGVGSFSNPGTNVARAIYDTIAARGADGEIYPYLAESIEPNEDLTEWTVTLREGIEFHDGTPLNAAAVERNFAVISADDSNLLGVLAQVEEFRVDDELTYTYVLAEPNVAFPDYLTGATGMPFSPDAYDANPDGFGDEPVGAGPFQFVSWTRDNEIRLEKNPNYWRTDANGNQLPYLDELIFRPIPDEDSRFASVEAGDAQVGQTLRQSFVRRAREAAENGNMQTFEAIGNNGGGAIFNTLRPPVDDVRVRQAMAHAIIQEDLIEILGGTGITPPQTQYFSPDSPWFSQEVADAWPQHDPERAQELLNEYINDPNRSDGKAVGEPVSVEFNTPPDPSLILTSQGYESMWRAVGIDVTLNSVEQAEHIQNAIGADADPPFSGNYMINIWRMGANEDPYITLEAAFGPWESEPTNFTNYTSDNVQEQLNVLATSTEFEERYAAVESIMMEFTEQIPNTWTAGTATALYADNAVRNLAGWTIPGDVQGDGVMNSTVYWSEVWLEE